MASEPSAPPGINPAVATAARMYDYYLGSHDNFAADRIAALKVIEAAPDIPAIAQKGTRGIYLRHGYTDYGTPIQLHDGLLAHGDGSGPGQPADLVRMYPMVRRPQAAGARPGRAAGTPSGARRGRRR